MDFFIAKYLHHLRTLGVCYKFFLFLLRINFLLFFSLCLFIFDRRFFKVLEHLFSNPLRMWPNHEEGCPGEGGRLRIVLVYAGSVENKEEACHDPPTIELLLATEVGDILGDEYRARMLLCDVKDMDIEDVGVANLLHHVLRAAVVAIALQPSSLVEERRTR